MTSKTPTAEQNVQAMREMRGVDEAPQTGDSLWDRILFRCPKCRHGYPAQTDGTASVTCGACGFVYLDISMLLDRLYLEVNILGGTPFDGPYNTAIGDVLTVLRTAGAMDVETERR